MHAQIPQHFIPSLFWLWAHTQTLLQQQINPLQAQGYSLKRTNPKGEKVWLITSSAHLDISSTINRTTPIIPVHVQINGGKPQGDRVYQFKCTMTHELNHPAVTLHRQRIRYKKLWGRKTKSSMSYILNQPNYSTIYRKRPITKQMKRLRPTWCA